MSYALLGLLGGGCFAVAGVPSALRALREGRNPGVPLTIAWLVFAGTLLGYSYLALQYFTRTGIDWVLTLNYAVEALSYATILVFHYRPRHS